MASGDVNGDGLSDFAAYAGAAGNDPIGQITLYVRNAGGARADALTGVSGDFGPRETVHYAPYVAASNPAGGRGDCMAPLECVSRAGFLVDHVDVDNGVGGTNSELHSYAYGRGTPSAGASSPLRATRSSTPSPALSRRGNSICRKT